MKNGYFHIELMISAAHMLGAMLPMQRENLEKMCNLVGLGVCFDQILHFVFLSDLFV